MQVPVSVLIPGDTVTLYTACDEWPANVTRVELHPNRTVTVATDHGVFEATDDTFVNVVDLAPVNPCLSPLLTEVW